MTCLSPRNVEGAHGVGDVELAAFLRQLAARAAPPENRLDVSILIFHSQPQVLPVFADRGNGPQTDLMRCERERGIPRPKGRQRFKRFCEWEIDLIQLEPGIDLQCRFLADDPAQLRFDRPAESFAEIGELPGFERQAPPPSDDHQSQAVDPFGWRSLP